MESSSLKMSYRSKPAQAWHLPAPLGDLLVAGTGRLRASGVAGRPVHVKDTKQANKHHHRANQLQNPDDTNTLNNINNVYLFQDRSTADGMVRSVAASTELLAAIATRTLNQFPCAASTDDAASGTGAISGTYCTRSTMDSRWLRSCSIFKSIRRTQMHWCRG